MSIARKYMDKKMYNAAAVKFNLWFYETKEVCKLRQDGLTLKKIKNKNKVENIFDAPSKEYSRTIMSVIAKRLDAGGGSFVTLFLRSDELGQKQLCLITCMLTDNLFFDFVSELIGAKLSCGLQGVSANDISLFWERERAKVDKIAQLNTSTIKVLTRTYRRYLSDAGVIDNNRKLSEIYPPIISKDIVKWISHKRIKKVLYALTGDIDGKKH